MTREISAHLLEQIKRHEGFRTHVYKCTASRNTIGYGHNIDADNTMCVADFKDGIGREEAGRLLLGDLNNARDQLFRVYPEFNDLKRPRIDSLINLVFNIGIGSGRTGKGVMGFRKMIRAIRHGDFEEAADQMLDSKWKGDVGPTRSHEVSEQLRTGEYA